MLKIKPRAEITQEFKDLIVSAARRRLESLHNDYERMNPTFKSRFMRDNAVIITNLKGIVSDAGKQDFLWTRLRSLPYTEYAVETWRDFTYLRATTKDITVSPDKVDIGPYWIFVNIDNYVDGKAHDLHFVPLRDPLNFRRFYHHDAYGPRIPDGTHRQKLLHHLDANPSTCWGTFGSFATAAFNAMDTPEMFRTFHVYLSRHNDHSNLGTNGMRHNGKKYCLPFERPL